MYSSSFTTRTANPKPAKHLPVGSRVTLFSASAIGFLAASVLNPMLQAKSPSPSSNLAGFPEILFAVLMGIATLSTLLAAFSLRSTLTRITKRRGEPLGDSTIEGSMIALVVAELATPTILLSAILNTGYILSGLGLVAIGLWAILHSALGLASAVQAFSYAAPTRLPMTTALAVKPNTYVYSASKTAKAQPLPVVHAPKQEEPLTEGSNTKTQESVIITAGEVRRSPEAYVIETETTKPVVAKSTRRPTALSAQQRPELRLKTPLSRKAPQEDTQPRRLKPRARGRAA
ncbi:MAG: hypothetical protein Q3962_00700 [Corynebacterium sp.]|nr:hypothetical protein [Corynebacterium sp.]